MSALIVERIDASNTRFQKAFAKLPPTVKKEAQLALGQLMLTDLLDPPAKLHIQAARCQFRHSDTTSALVDASAPI